MPCQLDYLFVTVEMIKHIWTSTNLIFQTAKYLRQRKKNTIFLHNAEYFFVFYHKQHTYLPLCHFSTKKGYKNLVKSLRSTKRVVSNFKKDVSWMKIKALSIAFKPFCCKFIQTVVNIEYEYCSSSGVQMFVPLFKQFMVYGTCLKFAPPAFVLCIVEKKKTCTKEMSFKKNKTFQRYKRQPTVSFHVKKKKKNC